MDPEGVNRLVGHWPDQDDHHQPQRRVEEPLSDSADISLPFSLCGVPEGGEGKSGGKGDIPDWIESHGLATSNFPHSLTGIRYKHSAIDRAKTLFYADD